MKKFISVYIFILSVLISASPAASQDITRLGGDLTSDLPAIIALQLPAPAILQGTERFNFHIDGHAQFHTTFDLLDPKQPAKIGPLFNHTSCVGCHVNDGKGPVKFSPGGEGSAMLVKVSLKGLNADGSPKNIPGTPEQIQDHQVSGKSPYRITLKFTEVPGKYPDGKTYSLRKPYLSFVIPGVDKNKVVSSLRMTPSVIGMGLLEQVPDSTIEAMADPFDNNGDGISGRVNYVLDLETNTKKIGRFGFRASNPSLLQQSAAALFHDMGVTSSLINDTAAEPEITDENLEKMVFYQQVPGVTAAVNQSDPDVIAGKEIFKNINCSGCHVMTLSTGASSIPELANQTFHPFTDLLLHDMGPGLADKRAEFSAKGSEWRTTPLWGLSTHKGLTKAKAGYLHDGRARTIEEAIHWHDGEAKASRKAFRSLNAEDRARLIKFVLSL